MKPRPCPAARKLMAQVEVARAERRWQRTRSHKAWLAFVEARRREMAL